MSVWFKLDRKAAGDQLLRNNSALQQMQSDLASNILATVSAQFLQQFGFPGSFEINSFSTNRRNIKIRASDARTGAILKANPKWLGQFVDNLVI